MTSRQKSGWCWAASVAVAFAGAWAPVTSSQVLFEEDFETAGGGWYATNGVWDAGLPTAGPGQAFTGTMCAGTVLTGIHPPDTDSRYESPAFLVPPIDAAGGDELWLEFRTWFSYSSCDYGVAALGEYDVGSGTWSWSEIGTSLVNTSPWSLKGVDLTSLAPKAETRLMKVGFTHVANSAYPCGGTGHGWFVDDVTVEVRQPTFSGSFEGGWNGWTTDRGVWQIGTPASGAAFEGLDLASTVMDANHPGDTDSRLVSPTLTLPTVDDGEALSLRFRSSFSYSSCDSGVVHITTFDAVSETWSSWVELGTTVVNWSPWSLKAVDLTPYAGKVARLAFYHQAQSAYPCSGNSTGWTVDDVQLDVSTPTLSGHFEFDWADIHATRGVWQVGPPPGAPEPSDAPSGGFLAGTVLGGQHPGDTDSRLVLGEVTVPALSGFQQAYLRFDQWFSYSSCDYGEVQVQVLDAVTGTWSSWTQLGSDITGSSTGWTEKWVPLTPHAGETLRIGFTHYASSAYPCGGNSLGWYIDEVFVVWGFPNYWGDMGLALGGTHGEPELSADGTLVAGTTTIFELSGTLANSVFALVVGHDNGMQPLKGGLLVPNDEHVILPLTTDGSGLGVISATWPGGVPTGQELYFQAWIPDAGAPRGYAASNALFALTP